MLPMPFSTIGGLTMRLLLFNLATDADDPILGFTTRWIQALAQRVQHIDVVTMRTGRLVIPTNVNVYSVGKEKGFSEPHRAFEFYRILHHLLTRQCYDACFAHMMQLFAVMANPLLRVQRIPTVLWYTHKSVTPLLQMATLLVDRIVTASEESFRIATPKVRATGHGIDTSLFVPARNGETQRPFTILTVGRLSPVKNVEVLINAIALLRQRHPELPFVFNLLGAPLTQDDRNYEAQLKNQVEQAGLQQQVRFLGSMPSAKVISAYQQADCFVSLSATGGLDKAVLEAMSCGIPVIVPSIYAPVLGAVGQQWVIPQDATALCDRLLRLHSLPLPNRWQLGDQLRQIVVQEHNLEKLCDRLIQEFQAVRR
jgi:glycosyltransferase involved in cell wall biosynthesis